MKEYWSIPHSAKAPREYCYAFYKHDGSNLRFEWHKKRGWNKQGTRHQLFDETHPVFGKAIKLFQDKYAEPIEKKLRDEFRGLEEAITFCEFEGPNSFAGIHEPDDVHDLILFDVNIHKRGILEPRAFLDLFGDLHIPELVYQGNLNDPFIEAVRNNTLPTKLNEGVVAKGGSGHKLWMTKIKTLEYLQKLKDRKGDDWTKFWE
jgi:hypothetical protein